MKIAIIGSGIAGLGAAWQLRDHATVTVFEKADRLGGHSHTITTHSKDGKPIAVDTGFIVYNEATYPNLIALFAELDIRTIPSDMSFAASLDEGRIEYAGDTLSTLIGHGSNLFRPGHWRMLIDLIRFMKGGHLLSKAPETMTLEAFLARHRYSKSFRDHHLLPMAGAIWSASPDQILTFPARSFGDFFSNHGLLEADIAKRPHWRTVLGGAKTYVEILAHASGAAFIMNAAIDRVESLGNRVRIHMQDGASQDFDHVVIATHADEAAELLAEQSSKMKTLLSAFRYSTNHTYLHSDRTLMPRREPLWASWNYMRRAGTAKKDSIFVSYWMNRLQSIDRATPLFVTLNPSHPPASEKIIHQQIYHHPQFDLESLAAQKRLQDVQGQNHIWLCGSYCGYGFHEDALASGLAVAAALGAPRRWTVTDISPAFANATPASAL